MSLTDKALVIGYGNPDREDDGVAWHILEGLAKRLGHPGPKESSDDLEHGKGLPDMLCLLQLYPELAEVIAEYDRVFFVDAHTGAFEEDIRLEKIEGEFLASPFTHHMTPATCLMLAETLYGGAPEGFVISVRGYRFGFSRELSEATAALAQVATERLVLWLSFEGTNEESGKH